MDYVNIFIHVQYCSSALQNKSWGSEVIESLLYLKNQIIRFLENSHIWLKN